MPSSACIKREDGSSASDERGFAEWIGGAAASRRAPGARQHVQRLLDGRVVEVVQVAVVVVHRGVLGVHIVPPGVREVALDAQYLARRVGDEGRDAITALDV